MSFRILLAAIAWLLASCIWGHTAYVSRMTFGATGGPAGYPTFFSGAARFSLAVLFTGCLAVLAWLLIKKPRMPNRFELRQLLTAGFLNGLGFAGLYYASRYVTGGTMGVLLAAQAPIVTLCAKAKGDTKVSWCNCVGSLLALLAVAAVFCEQLQFSPDQAVPIAVVAGSSFLLAISIFNLREAREVGVNLRSAIFFAPIALVLWLAAAVEVFVLGCKIPDQLPLWPTVGIFYLATVGVVLPYVLFFYVMNEHGEVAGASIDLGIPLFALLTDYLLEPRPLTLGPSGWVGVVVVLIGLALNLIRVRKRASPAPLPAACPAK
jgi:drug/metabolite transporter (DMT)-like permease